jgi:Tfp pilus assembly protein PilN
MRAINLLPRDDSRRRGGGEAPNKLVIAGVLMVVVLTAVFSGLFLMASGKASQKRATLKDKQSELASIPTPPPTELKTQEDFAADKKQRVTALNGALGRRVAWDRVMREFALVLPDDVWLKSMSAKSPLSPSAAGAAAAPATGSGSALPPATGFTIEGFTYSHAAVARLLTRLQLVPDLKNVQLQSSELAKVGGRQLVHWRIVADLRAPGATS